MKSAIAFLLATGVTAFSGVEEFSVPTGTNLAINNNEARVKKVIVELLGVDQDDVKNYMVILDDLVYGDEIEYEELVMAIELEFDTDIPDAFSDEMGGDNGMWDTTVQHFIDYVGKLES